MVLKCFSGACNWQSVMGEILCARWLAFPRDIGVCNLLVNLRSCAICTSRHRTKKKDLVFGVAFHQGYVFQHVGLLHGGAGLF